MNDKNRLTLLALLRVISRLIIGGVAFYGAYHSYYWVDGGFTSLLSAFLVFGVVVLVLGPLGYGADILYNRELYNQEAKQGQGNAPDKDK